MAERFAGATTSISLRPWIVSPLESCAASLELRTVEKRRTSSIFPVKGMDDCRRPMWNGLSVLRDPSSLLFVVISSSWACPSTYIFTPDAFREPS